MGRRSLSGGICPAGPSRIQFTFQFEGVRYRPTLKRVPTEANLRRAREHLIGIKTRISAGTFSFAEEFPSYVHLKKVPRGGIPADLRPHVRRIPGALLGTRRAP